MCVHIFSCAYSYNFNKTTTSSSDNKFTTFVGNSDKYYENIFGYVYCELARAGLCFTRI